MIKLKIFLRSLFPLTPQIGPACKMAWFVLFGVLLLHGCVTPPPRKLDNVCQIFKQYPRWLRETRDVQKRWRVPIPVLMAIMHQESKFNAQARPPRKKLLWIIPWTRPTSAYGYSQALNGTWAEYRRTSGDLWSSRDNFGDAVDFMGWYANQAYLRAHVSRQDAYRLYLAYHEGIGGYQRHSYLKKPWLIGVAKKVKVRAEIYRAQMKRCRL